MTEEADTSCSSAPLPVVQPGLNDSQEKVDESDTEENDADNDADDNELADDDDDDDDGDESVDEGESSILGNSDDPDIILVE